ncbi:MAG TPA: hypothetical protein VJR89_19660 [Polyangiales bacterium]|nr:hypothetical protein [Polyangiales bacterium]
MTEPRSPRARLAFAACASALACAHLAWVDYFAPLSAIFTPRPIQGVDFDLHIGQVYRVVEGLRGWGKSWVYDVRLLAGQPEGAITDAGSKAWELWTYLLHAAGVDLAIAFNSWVLLVMLACPVLIYAAARSFELSAPASLGAAALASALWFFDSFVHWVWFVGMVSWALASCSCALTLGLFYRFVRTRSAPAAIGCGVCLGLGHLIHPYSFFVLAVPLAALYLRARKTLPGGAQLAIAGMIVFTLASNAYWLIVAAQHWHYVLDSAFYAQGKLAYLAYDFLGVLRAGSDTGVIGVRSGFRLACFALAVAGLVSLRRSADPRGLPLAIGVIGVGAFAYLGASLVLFAQMQPYRTLVAASLLSTIPAALFLERAASELQQKPPALATRLLLAACALLVVQHLAQEVLYFAPRALPETEAFPDGSPSPLMKYGFLKRPEGPSHVTYSVPHPPDVEAGYDACVRWLEEHVPAGARLLVEGGVLGERIAWRTRFEVLGGFVERNVAHAYANYFRRYHAPPPEPEIASYLRSYAVEYVITVYPHPELERSPALQLIHTLPKFRIYRVLQPTTRVLSGRGQVEARTNRIDVRGSDPDQPLLLSYHFHEALRCEPACRVERETRVMDVVGFIRIPAPHPRELRIFNAYR